MQDQPQQHLSAGGVYKWLLWAFALACLLAVFPGLVMLFLFGMLPTLVAFWIDRTPQKYSAYCLGALNFSGVFPSLLELWTGKNNVAQAWEIISADPFNMAIMYGSAGVGMALYIFLPSLIVAFMTVIAQHRIADLRARQRELVKVWGTDITVAETEEEPEEA